MLKTIEEHGLGEKKFFGGNTIGLVDLAFGGIAHWLPVIEDVVGVKLIVGLLQTSQGDDSGIALIPSIYCF